MQQDKDYLTPTGVVVVVVAMVAVSRMAMDTERPETPFVQRPGSTVAICRSCVMATNISQKT